MIARALVIVAAVTLASCAPATACDPALAFLARVSCDAPAPDEPHKRTHKHRREVKPRAPVHEAALAPQAPVAQAPASEPEELPPEPAVAPAPAPVKPHEAIMQTAIDWIIANPLWLIVAYFVGRDGMPRVLAFFKKIVGYGVDEAKMIEAAVAKAAPTFKADFEALQARVTALESAGKPQA